MSVVFDFNASLNDVAPLSPILFPVDRIRMKKSGLLMDAICVLFLLCSRPRLSLASVVFDFSALPNDVAPFFPMLFPFGLMRMGKSGLLTDAICVLFLLCSQLRSSSVSAMFAFSASLNDVAPALPIMFSVDLKRIEKSGLSMDIKCGLFLLSSRVRLSLASVVFDFNASLNDVAPPFSILLPVELRNGKSGLLMDVVCLLLLSC